MSKVKSKFDKKICNTDMTFEDCEMAILRNTISEIDELKESKKKTGNIDIKSLISVVEDFIKRKKLICYGGTAINNILPKYDQFYDKDTTIPDYDFYSATPIEDAKELCNIYYKNGYRDIEAKTSAHHGTFKVFVNFIAVADITFIHPDIQKSISKDAIVIDNIHYAPPEFLRMSMYLELSRPKGDVDRWEKVLKRLNLLNKHYPLKYDTCDEKTFLSKRNISDETNLLIRNAIIDDGAVFFGGYSSLLYSKYMVKQEKNLMKEIPDFDVISKDTKRLANIIAEKVKKTKQKVKVVHHKGIDEIIPPHCEVIVNNKSVVFIYEPIACHNYNVVKIDEKEINIATIETILSFYLAFISINMKNYNKNRLLCISELLFKVLEENKTYNKGILKRFPLTCIGEQQTLSDIKAEKARKYKEFKARNLSKNSKEYEMWFLRYTPYKKNLDNSKSKKSVSKSSRNKTLKNNSLSTKSKYKMSFLF